MFSALFLTLPAQSGALRVRTWRGLKALGCGALRDGVYLLPAEHAGHFDPIADEVRASGGQAQVLDLTPRDDEARVRLLGLFDRGEAYAQWQADARALALELPSLPEVDARRRWRGIAEHLDALRRIDYYPDAAALQAQAELDALRQALESSFSRGEPIAQPHQGIARLDRGRYQGRTWATRSRPWVDRLACVWLIRRFIDARPHFLWLEDPAGSTPAPRHALGFDYDGARFTHVGARVSFEVLAISFGLDTDPRLRRIAQAVHVLDVGGIPVPEAIGLEAVLAGLREIHRDDDQLTLSSDTVFDAIYASPAKSP